MTILEGLQQLPDGIRERAIEEYERQYWDWIKETPSVSGEKDALTWAFDWWKSKDGYDYWLNVHENLMISENTKSDEHKMPLYNFADLISFGNYLLSDKRAELIKARREEPDGANLPDANWVTDADIENWKEQNKTA